MVITVKNIWIHGPKCNDKTGLRAETDLRAGEVCQPCMYNMDAHRFEETCMRSDPNGPPHTYISETRACREHNSQGI